MTKRPKVMITTRAAAQRINRALKPDLEGLKKARTQQAILDVGQYYVINYSKNYVVHHDVDLETFGQELGVIQPWEAVADD
jgi:hypothetical protein